ncbi:MAG: hypothetical protein HMLIMOIP_001900 [Candidatus Nitrosomirales archaeon]|jgi:hypothetical protein
MMKTGFNTCKKHNIAVPMLPVYTEMGIKVGVYCIFCTNFVPNDADAELAPLKTLMRQSLGQSLIDKNNQPIDSKLSRS